MILQTDGGDPQFAAKAAERGVFAFASQLEADALQAAIEVAVRRFDELEELSEQVENLEGALRRRAIVERAKGILMERQGIDERAAFERCASAHVRQPDARRGRPDGARWRAALRA